MKTPKRNPDPNVFLFTRTGSYLDYRIIVSQKGVQVDEVKLFGPARPINMERLMKYLGFSKATNVVAFGKPTTNATWGE